MAGYDPARYEDVLHWPLRELFLARAAQVHAAMTANLYHRQLITVLRPSRDGKTKMPNPPRWFRRPLA